MVKLRTITTIELSNICNLACLYCINRLLVKHPARKPGIMKDDVFEATVELLAILVRQGTQKTINLNGNGEATLDPNFLDRAAIVREIVGPHIQIGLSTNGLTMTPELAKGMKDLNLMVDLSPHSPYHVRRAWPIMAGTGLMEMGPPPPGSISRKGTINGGAMFASHNWAGQLEAEHQAPVTAGNPICEPLMEGRGYVQKEGYVSPCCYDYRNLGTFGHVSDPRALFKTEFGPYELCRSCHQKLPAHLKLESIPEAAG